MRDISPKEGGPKKERPEKVKPKKYREEQDKNLKTIEDKTPELLGQIFSKIIKIERKILD
jgi:hypothetical protein